MILTTLFILALAWSISRGIKGSSLASQLARKTKEVKPRIEMIIPVKEAAVESINTIHLTDYINEKRINTVSGKIQTITLPSLPGSSESELFLN